MFQNFLKYLSAIPRKHPWFTIGAIATFFILAIVSSQNVYYDQGVETYFSKDSKVYSQFLAYSRNFGGGNAAYIFIKGDDILTREVFEYMLTLEKEIAKIPGVTGVTSPANIVVSLYGDLPEDELLLRNIALDRASSMIPDNSFALMRISLTDNEDEYNQIAKIIENKLEYITKPVGVTVVATGDPILRYQIQEAIGSSMSAMFLTSIVLMIAILLIVFRGIVRHKIMALSPLIMAVITAVSAFGIMPIIGIPLTEMTNGFLPILIGLSIEYAVQFQSRYEEERKLGNSVDTSLTNAIQNTGQAIILAMVTTVIGFLSMYFSGVPALGYFGLMVSVGLIIAFILSITLLPALYKIIDRSNKTHPKSNEANKNLVLKNKLDMSRYLSKYVALRPKTVLAIGLVVVVVGGYGYSHVGLETDFMKYMPQDLPAIQRINELQRIMGSQDSIIVIIENEEVLSKNFIEKIDALGRYIDGVEQDVEGKDSIAEVIKEFSGTLPDDENTFRYYLSAIPPEMKTKYVSGNTLMAVYFPVKNMDWIKFKELYNRINEEVRFFGISSGFYLTGSAVLKMFISDLIINGQQKMTLASYLLVFILLFVVYRSVSKSIIPIIAISSVIAVVGGVMFGFGMPRTLLTASLNSMIIGLGIDFSIHITERYREERSKGKTPEEAVTITVNRIGRAITTSALTMAGGFAAMMVSDFPMMRNFGFISLIAIIFSLIAALTIVPAFLVFVDKEKENFKNKLVE
jgi:hypothetical protein